LILGIGRLGGSLESLPFPRTQDFGLADTIVR
jgi:hypothetical protein